MAQPGNDHAISVMMEHVPGDHRTVANFYWPTHQPTETYTLAKGNISLRLDEHTVVRPSEVVWRESSTIGDEEVLAELFGPDFATELIEVRNRSSLMLIDYTFSQSSRLAIARLQFESPSTPANLQRVLGGMIGELSLDGEASPADPPQMIA